MPHQGHYSTAVLTIEIAVEYPLLAAQGHYFTAVLNIAIAVEYFLSAAPAQGTLLYRGTKYRDRGRIIPPCRTAALSLSDLQDRTMTSAQVEKALYDYKEEGGVTI